MRNGDDVTSGNGTVKWILAILAVITITVTLFGFALSGQRANADKISDNHGFIERFSEAINRIDHRLERMEDKQDAILDELRE